MTDAISVLIAEEQPLYRRAVVGLVASAAPRLRLVADVADHDEAISLVQRLKPDIVLVGLTGLDDFTCITELRMRAPESKIVAFSMHADGDTVVDAIHAGVTGFIPRMVEPGDVIATLHRVAAGETTIHPDVVADAFLAAMRRLEAASASVEILGRLSRREREILGSLSEGLSSKLIGQRLFISRRTVDSHLGRVYQKLDVHSRSQAVRRYAELMGTLRRTDRTASSTEGAAVVNLRVDRHYEEAQTSF